jgi:ubiquitin carboxyl-terminal hydrolase 14
LSKSLLRLFESLDATKDAVQPVALWLALMGAFPNFAEMDHGHPMQHDSQEALAALLQNALQLVQDDADLRAKYGNLFHGSMTSQTFTASISESGEKTLTPHSTERSNFTILPCNISGEAQTLEAGLEQAMTETISTKNEATGSDVVLEKKTQLDALPEYLFVHFVRFHWRKDINAKTKILKPISFPLVLDVLSLCSEDLKARLQPGRERVKLLRDAEVERRKRSRQKSGLEQEEEATAAPAAAPAGEAEDIPMTLQNDNGFYELCAVISHKGRSAEGGHYIAWVLKAGTWLVVDDHNVAAVSVEDVKRLRGVGEAHIAYVLLYRSRDPVTGALPLLL